MRELDSTSPWADAVRRAAAVLYDAGATAVWLFGSRAGRGTADHLSDFDLGVEGLNGATAAIKDAARELRGNVDIVQLESANPVLRWAITRDRVMVPHIKFIANAPHRVVSLPDSLAGMRILAVADWIRNITPRAVIDFGCGYGWLLAQLATDGQYERLTGVDFSPRALAGARKRIAATMGAGWESTVHLREGLITSRDPAFLGHDAAAAIEVIEHLERPQLTAFVNVVFDFLRPARAVITTPNREYNVLLHRTDGSGHRHPDHRFEWSRSEFAEWANRIAADHAYKIHFDTVGDIHAVWGAPTQLAVFDRIGN
jgi:2-polyprenyl-3-methyl-5-hydroxy-6-metoxy-1,4-benzoquinol methylase